MNWTCGVFNYALKVMTTQIITDHDDPSASPHTSKYTMKSIHRILFLTRGDSSGASCCHFLHHQRQVQRLIPHPLSGLHGSIFSRCKLSIKAASSFWAGSCCSIVNEGNVRQKNGNKLRWFYVQTCILSIRLPLLYSDDCHKSDGFLTVISQE